MTPILFARNGLTHCSALALLLSLLARLKIDNFLPSTKIVYNLGRQRWHGRAGWTFVGALVLIWATGFALDIPLATTSKASAMIHAVPISICAFAVIRKIWIRQHQIGWPTKRVIAWTTTAVILGVCFSIATLLLATRQWVVPSATSGGKLWQLYQNTALMHVGITLLLMWLGRIALKSWSVSVQMKGSEDSKR
jgi:hypothetical protein